MSDIKLTFACDKCGTVLGDIYVEMTEYGDYWSVEDMFTCPKCPKCDAPTFGALTVEMVAEALCDSAPLSRWADWSGMPCEFSKDDFRAMARFVLRLLEELGTSKPTLEGCAIDDWRACLQRIAKQP